MSTAPTGPPTGPAGPALARALTRLEHSSQELTALLAPEVLASLPDELVGDVAERLAAVAERAQAGAWAALARVVDSGLPQAQGAASAGMWWRERIRASKDEAGARRCGWPGGCLGTTRRP